MTTAIFIVIANQRARWCGNLKNQAYTTDCEACAASLAMTVKMVLV